MDLVIHIIITSDRFFCSHSATFSLFTDVKEIITASVTQHSSITNIKNRNSDMLWIVPITILAWKLACLPSLVLFSVISLCVYSIRDGSKEGWTDCPCCTKEKKVIDASKIQSHNSRLYVYAFSLRSSKLVLVYVITENSSVWEKDSGYIEY